MFSGFDKVRDARVAAGKGFGFVKMDSHAEAEKEKKELSGIQFMGQTLAVEEACSKRDRLRRGGPYTYREISSINN